MLCCELFRCIKTICHVNNNKKSSNIQKNFLFLDKGVCVQGIAYTNILMIKKTVLMFTLLFIFILAPAHLAYCAPVPNPSLKIIIDEKKINLRAHPIFISNHVYVPLREVCDNLGITIDWSNSAQCATLCYKGKQTKITTTGEYTWVNGVKKERSHIIKGNFYLSARLIAEIFDFSVQWNEAFKLIRFDTQSPKSSGARRMSDERIVQILSAGLPYTNEDIYWMSRIVHAEACGESYESKLAVANVILNREKNGHYPDTIKDVIFDSNYGVQFTPTANGAIYNTPSTESIAASLDAFGGVNNAKNILFFLNPRKSNSFWITKNRAFGFSLGNHDFYY